MKTSRNFAGLAGLVLYVLTGCAVPDLPAGRGGPGGSAADVAAVCDASPDLGLNLRAAAAVPVIHDDLTLGTLGLGGAETLAMEMTSGDGFCSFEVSPTARLVIDQAVALIELGQPAAARALLATLLEDADTGAGFPGLVGLKVTGQERIRQRVRDLLAAAWTDQLAGGDGVDLHAKAGEVYSAWAQKQLRTADAREAMTIGGEANLLDLDDLELDAEARAREVTVDEMEKAIKEFDPCTAGLDDGRALLQKEAKLQLVGAVDEEESAQIRINELLDQMLRRLWAKILQEDNPLECVKLSVEPMSATLGPGGRTLSLAAIVTGVKGESLSGVAMSVSGVTLGSISPTSGSTALGRWTALYTSRETGTETLTFRAVRFDQSVEVQVVIHIGGLMFEQTDSGSFAAFSVAGSTCDGQTWHGTVSATAGGADLSGTFSFTMPEGGATAETVVAMGGTSRAGPVTLTFRDELTMTFALQANATQATITLVSTGVGQIDTPAGPVAYSAFPSPGEATVDLETNPDCGAP